MKPYFGCAQRVARLWKPALGPSSLRAVIVNFPGMTGHQGNLVPHSVAIHGVPVAQQFDTGGIVTLLVLSVILVAFAGGLTNRARQVVQTAVSVLAVALGLGWISWLGALGAHLRPGVWFIFDALDLAAVAAALIFSVAVLRSQALRRSQALSPGMPGEGWTYRSSPSPARCAARSTSGAPSRPSRRTASGRGAATHITGIPDRGQGCGPIASTVITDTPWSSGP